MEAEEEVGTHGKDGGAHVGRKLGPELLSCGEGNAVLSGFGNEGCGVGADEVLELIGIDGKKPAMELGKAGLSHDVEGQFGEEEAAEYVGVLFAEFALGKIDDDV